MANRITRMTEQYLKQFNCVQTNENYYCLIGILETSVLGVINNNIKLHLMVRL